MHTKENSGSHSPGRRWAALWAALNLIASTAAAQTFTVLHAFSSPTLGINLDGANPLGALAPCSGVLCGTTAGGGSYAAGVVFGLNTDGSGFATLRVFTNAPDAGFPEADLQPSANGFFGATAGGGTQGTGAIFAGQTNGAGSIVYNFAALNADSATNLSGASPGGSVVIYGNRLYGVATAGGPFANGVLFALDTNGANFSVLHSFTKQNPATGTNSDGAVPRGRLVLSDDTLYGTTCNGGAGGNGTVFSVNTNGGNFTTLYSFTAMDPLTGTNTDGAMPMAGLALANGALYGTAIAGGSGASGTIFVLSTDGSGFKVLHHFSSLGAVALTNADGAAPQSAVIMSGCVLYGTAPAGGAGAAGTVFSVNTYGGGFSTLYSFTAVDPNTSTNTDGAIPAASLLQLGNVVYGTTFGGGSGAAGTVFSLSVPSVPANIIGIVGNSDRSVTLSFLGSPNSTNVIQATASLGAGASWQNLSTNVADSLGFWEFTDTSAVAFPRQFYRSYSR